MQYGKYMLNEYALMTKSPAIIITSGINSITYQPNCYHNYFQIPAD